MRQMSSTTINVANISSSIVSSRDVADSLKEPIIQAKTNLVALDFKDVEFVSRSASHELLLMKEELRISSQKDISFINTNSDVSGMLRVIAANRAAPKNPHTESVIERSDLESLLKEHRV